MTNLTIDREITPSELHVHTGRLLRQHYRDGAALAVRDRWGEVIAVIIIGPEAVSKIAGREPRDAAGGSKTDADH